jgi:adenosylcobinamide-GDP ribazoletransferase
VVLSVVWMAGERAGDFVAAALVIAISLLLTGAMHEDGLADTADALGGGAGRERVLAILKDSRIGSFGSAALTVTLLLRVALLTRLGPFAPWGLVLTAAASRLAPVFLMATLPYVTDPTTSKSLSIVRTGRAQVVVAVTWVVALGGALGALHVMTLPELGSAVIAMLFVTLICGAQFRARVGGITGDFLGATQQLSECAMLLALALVRGGGAS